LQTKAEEKNTGNGRDNDAFVTLVKRATTGEHEALIELCQTIVKGILFRTTRILGNQTDAEDVTQDVMICVCTHIHELREPKAFYVWLNRIIMNETNRYFMKRSKHGVLLNIEDYQYDVEDNDKDFVPQEYAIREADRKAVIDIVDGLPGQQRKAILLHYYDGMTLADSAKIMGVSQPRVSRCLKFAQEKIRKELVKQAKGLENAAYGLAMLPLEPMLSQVLHQEAALFSPENIVFSTEMITNIATIAGGTAATAATAATAVSAVAGGAAGGSSAGATSSGTAAASSQAGVIATVAAAVAVSAGILVGAPAMQQEEPDPPPTITAEYHIAFAGGSASGEHVNPIEAVAHLTTIERGEMIALDWWITEDGDDVVLYSGEGGIVNDVLVQMKTRGEDGEYILCFNMQDYLGDTWTLSRSFKIETG